MTATQITNEIPLVDNFETKNIKETRKEILSNILKLLLLWKNNWELSIILFGTKFMLANMSILWEK
jgi:hypothetical protein